MGLGCNGIHTFLSAIDTVAYLIFALCALAAPSIMDSIKGAIAGAADKLTEAAQSTKESLGGAQESVGSCGPSLAANLAHRHRLQIFQLQRVVHSRFVVSSLPVLRENVHTKAPIP